MKIALKPGHCFGLSVIHGAMDHIKKMNWWEEALVTIANWDGTAAALDHEVKLQGAEENAYWQTKKEREKNKNLDKSKVKLKYIFERVLYYILSHQAMAHLFVQTASRGTTSLCHKDLD